MKFTIFSALLITSLIGTTVYAQDLASGAVKFKPKKINFNTVLTDSCRPKKVEAINKSDAPVNNPAFEIVGASEFSIQRGFRSCADPLDPGESCRVYVDFCPSLNRPYEATLYFSGDNNFTLMTGEGGAGGPGGR